MKTPKTRIDTTTSKEVTNAKTTENKDDTKDTKLNYVGWPTLCVARPYWNKEVIKRALILNLNIHHALK